MLTQEQALAELRQLNMELGLAEDDGIPMTQAQAEAELRRLDEELASTPESFDEYVVRRKEEDSRSIGEKTSAFTDSFLTGAGTLAQEGGRAIKQLFSGGVGAKELKGVFQVGIEDFGRFAKTLGGAAMDNFYSDEEEMKREYERYKDNFLYNQNVRTAMLNTFDEEGRDFVSFGANFVDPTMLVPVAGQVAKLGSIGLKSARLGKLANAIEKGGAIASKPTELVAKGTRKAIEKTAQVGSKIAGATGKAGEVTAKAAAFPRNVVTKLAGKAIDPKVAGSGILGAQVTGAFTGAVPGLGLLTSAEVAGYIANKSGRGMERVLTALGSEAGQKRFLQRLAMEADSPTTRKLALYAHKLGGTRMGDMAFNSLVNGISVSALNGALAYASTDNIEELGQAMGAGFAMGGALPVGQPGMKAGKSQAARDQSSVNFLEAKLGQDQLKQFRKMDPDARLAFATVEEAGIKAPKLMFVDKDLMLQTLREDDPNIRQAPNAYFNQTDNTIYVNENGRASKSSKEAFDILTHELGHGFITQAIKDDPFFARKILAQYEAKPGEKAFEFAFTTDSAGAPIDSIMLNEKAKKIASAYDNIQEGDKSIGVGMNANTLAQEIGAEQFAMMMVDNPNYFNTIEPSLRQKLLEGSRKVLTLFGAVDGNTGNPLDVSISPLLKRNKTIRNLYTNYTKQRDASIAHKVDLAEKGVAMKVRKGESADQAVERLYGKQGISLREAGAFRIDNKKVKNELTNILNRLDEAPEGGMSSERNRKSGRPQAIVGKQLSDEVKGVFTRKDPRGTINMLINDITEAIRDKLQLNFLYRSGKPSKYSDNELRARVVTPIEFKVTGLSKGSQSAASLKMGSIDEAYLRNNVEVLVKEGFADNPNDLIELAREVAKTALSDEEGRINPQGKYENELITAVFGEPTSAPQIRNAKLRQLLEDGKLKTSYRSYDVDALAGLVPTGKSGIAFDWFNIKNNYSPFDDKLFIPAYHGTPHTFAAEPGAPLGRFRTSAIGTGEGAQAYGHGLYFAGRKEVAEFYREQLAPTITKDFKVGTMNIFKDEVPMDYSPDKLERVYGKEANARASLIEELMIDEGTIRRAFIEDGEKGAKREVKKVIESFLDSYEGEADYIKVGKKALDMPVKFDTTEPGSLYKVELAPKENEYLLWDKPLSEQPKGVREKLDLGDTSIITEYEKLRSEKFPSGRKVSDKWNPDKQKRLELLRSKMDQLRMKSHDGKSFYEMMTDKKGSAEKASQHLRRLGIPGIKYLDGSSRSKGEGDYNYVIFDEADVQITDKLFMPTEIQEGSPGSFFRPKSARDKSAKLRTFKSPVYLKDGSRLSGVADNPEQNPFYGFDKNGQEFSQRREYVNPQDITKSRDSDRTANQIRNELESGQKLFMPASEAGAGKGKQAEAAKLWNEKGTDSPYFKKWFGKSKVVDENGEPLVVYRGQTQWSKDGTMDYKEQRAAPSFTSVPEVANMYTHVQTGDFFTTKVKPKGAVSPVYLKMDNPLKIETLENISSTRGSVLEILDASSFNWDFYGDVKPDKSLWTIDDTIDLFSNLSDPADPILVEVERGWGMPNIADDAFEIAEYLSNKLEKHQEKLRKLDKDSSEYMRLEDDFTEDINYFLDNVKIDTYAFADTHVARDYAERNGFDGFIHEDVAEGISPYASMDTVAGKPIEEVKGIKTTDEDGERLKKEDYSFTVYKPFKSEQIKSATGNRGTFDAGERNINYMPSDRKAPTRQPANRITRQAPAMPGNRFMLPAVSAGAKSAERFR